MSGVPEAASSLTFLAGFALIEGERAARWCAARHDPRRAAERETGVGHAADALCHGQEGLAESERFVGERSWEADRAHLAIGIALNSLGRHLDGEGAPARTGTVAQARLPADMSLIAETAAADRSSLYGMSQDIEARSRTSRRLRGWSHMVRRMATCDDAAARITVATLAAVRHNAGRADARRRAMLALADDPRNANLAIRAPFVLTEP